MGTNAPARYDELSQGLADLGKVVPSVMDGFSRLHRNAITGGALDERTKELMALAIAVAVRCDGCIAFHVHDAVRAGATRDEVAEAIGVAVLMGGGPAAVYGTEALRAYEQFAEA
jgi:AhpD family alkylhydroperoxidase